MTSTSTSVASAATGRLVYVNGQYVPENQASVSIFDSALMFGDMVFEMTRTFNHKHFKMREHLERLYRSIKSVQIPSPMPIDDMERLVDEVVERNRALLDDDDEERMMINVSRGPLSIYKSIFGGNPGPTLVISVFPLSWTMEAIGYLYESGIHAVIPSQRQIPAELLDPKNKNRSRMHYLMANLQVSLVDDPNVWALLLDPDGFVTEGTGSNFFIVSNGELVTPEPRNVLRGISRDYVMGLGVKLGMKVCERNFDEYDVMHADEAFFTCTPGSIVPCTKINGRPIGEGAMGPTTTKLLDAWSDEVGVDIVAQAQEFYRRTSGDAAGASPYRFGGADNK